MVAVKKKKRVVRCLISSSGKVSFHFCALFCPNSASTDKLGKVNFEGENTTEFKSYGVEGSKKTYFKLW